MSGNPIRPDYGRCSGCGASMAPLPAGMGQRLWCQRCAMAQSGGWQSQGFGMSQGMARVK